MLPVSDWSCWIARAALGLTLGWGFPAPTGAAAPAGRVDVLLWFDSEDFLLAADDDATLRLCEMLTARDMRATFKVVGEKARTLERRGRPDVIAAMRKHDIGYHTDFHSVHPTPAEYLAECGWLDGVAEFVRRERDGAEDVKRIFRVPALSCYGQPGAAWAAQAVAALPQIGVRVGGVSCYVDDDAHVGMNGVPFWYAGALHVFRMRPNLTRLPLHQPAALAPAKQEFSAIAGRLRGEGGGLISIFYHPNEWVHRVFWDAVNFAHGANPPREQWQAPPQRPPAETDGAFQRFGEYLDHIRSVPGVCWITASDLPGRYPDEVRTRGVPERDLDELAAQMAAGDLDYRKLGPRVYSVADQFEVLTLALLDILEGRPVRFPLTASGLLGPDSAVPKSAFLPALAGPAFREALRDAGKFVRSERRVPARVFVGADMLAPADFLVAMGTAWNEFRRTGTPLDQQTVPLRHDVQILAERHVAKDTPNLYGAWIPHRAGFRAPKIVELARLQAWTIKPATRAALPPAR